MCACVRVLCSACAEAGLCFALGGPRFAAQVGASDELALLGPDPSLYLNRGHARFCPIPPNCSVSEVDLNAIGVVCSRNRTDF